MLGPGFQLKTLVPVCTLSADQEGTKAGPGLGAASPLAKGMKGYVWIP